MMSFRYVEHAASWNKYGYCYESWKMNDQRGQQFYNWNIRLY